MSETIDATTPATDAGSPALAELRANLQYARGLVQGGRSLARLQIGAFDVTDLYRAAWVQAVSALDHWVHRELYDRAVALAAQVSADRPKKFLAIKVPMELLESVHHRSEDLADAFRRQLRAEFGRQTFQQPEDIRGAFGHVKDGFSWAQVARRIDGQDAAAIKDRLTAIAWRRNEIAHSTDRDPVTGVRTPMGSEEVAAAIDWIERLAAAIVEELGPMPAVPEPKPKKRWRREDLVAAAAAAGPEVEKVVGRLLEHGDRHRAKVTGGVGAVPSAGVYYPTRLGARSLWSVYLTPDRPSLSLNLGLISSIDPDVTRRFLADLRRSPALDDALIAADDDLVGKYPTVYLAVLVGSDDALEALLGAYDRVLSAVRG